MGGGACQPTKALASFFPNSTFTATDLSSSNVQIAQVNVEGKLFLYIIDHWPHVTRKDNFFQIVKHFVGLSNVQCKVLDACNVPGDMKEQFDLIMLFDVYHDVPHPQKLVDGALKLLKKGGQFLMNEILAHERVTDNKNSQGMMFTEYIF